MSRRCAAQLARQRIRRSRATADGRDSRDLGRGLRRSAASALLVLRDAFRYGRPNLRAWPDPSNPPLENVPLENLLGLFLNIQYLVEDAIGYVEFIEMGEREFAAIAEEEGDDVGVGIEAGAGLRDVIRDDHGGGFTLQLAARVFCDVICFSGEAYEDAIGFLAA